MSKKFDLKDRQIVATHSSTVQSILGADLMLPVQSSGSNFYCRAHYPFRQVISYFSNWSSPDFQAWARSLNAQVVDPMINIASGSENLSREGFLALVGGGYHEAGHRKYTYQGNISPEALSDVIGPRWDKAEWGKGEIPKLLLDWSNIVEDIRIERRLCREFPGIRPRMETLCDFILSKEGQDAGRAERAESNPMPIISCLFRDLGMGYETSLQESYYNWYRKVSPRACALVEYGPLKPLLDEAIRVSGPEHDDDHGAMLRIAMDIILVLSKLKRKLPEGEAPEGIPTNPGTNPGNGDPGYVSEDSESDGSGGSGGESDGSDSDGSDSDGSGSDSDGESDGSDSGSDSDGSGSDSSDSEDSKSPGDSTGGDGAGDDETPLTDLPIEGMHDPSSALGDEIKEDFQEDLEEGEKPYRPFSTQKDIVKNVRSSREGSERARRYEKEVRGQITSLASKLRSRFRALENQGKSYGKKGRRLAGRYLTQTVSEIRSERQPTRPFQRQGVTLDTSVAVSIVVDESSSMDWLLKDTTKALIALAVSMESIGAKSLVTGFMVGRESFSSPWNEEANYHRYGNIVHHVFKDWNDRLTTDVKARLASIRASGGTPMADGVQFGLDALSTRREGHRIMFVLTDGYPAYSHSRVIKRQLRLAKEAGIHIIGIGLMTEAVVHVFDDHIVINDMSELPEKLIGKLDLLISGIGNQQNRGRRVQSTG